MPTSTTHIYRHQILRLILTPPIYLYTYIPTGEDVVEYDESFRLFLQTKLSNPHYRPEVLCFYQIGCAIM